MRKIREVLRLRYECGLHQAAIGNSCDISKTSVHKYLDRARCAGLSWPLPADLDDASLEARLFPRVVNTVATLLTLPDWAEIHLELKKKGVTRMLLWHEYMAKYPQGLGYSQFCEYYRQWNDSLKLSMRQHHRAGEKLFVDYAGKTVPIFDPATGEVRNAQIFVAVWGASSFTYADASFSQDLPSWTSSHVKAFEYFGCVPEIVVPDNLKSAVTVPCRYDPDLNPTYAELSAHYGFAIIPARVRHPKDKAKAELGVLLVTRWILAVLRHRKFFSLASLNAAIAKLLETLNDKPFQKLPGSRRSTFELLDRPAAQPLTQNRYVYAEVLGCRVNIDYHIAVDDHYYSVPYQLRGEKVAVRLTANAVEVLHKNRRIYTHSRSYKKWGYTTLREHMPDAHRRYLEWSPSRLLSWGETVGPATSEVVRTILESKSHPEQGYRSCLGVFRLGKSYNNERLEAACRRAIAFGRGSYKSVKSILECGLDRQPLAVGTTNPVSIHHANIRGGDYYKAPTMEEAHNADERNDNATDGTPIIRNDSLPRGAESDDRVLELELRGEDGHGGGSGGDRSAEPAFEETHSRGQIQRAGHDRRHQLEEPAEPRQTSDAILGKLRVGEAATQCDSHGADGHGENVVSLRPSAKGMP